jgi:hypothetical protein
MLLENARYDGPAQSTATSVLDELGRGKKIGDPSTAHRQQLARVGLITSAQLKSKRRYAIFMVC